MKKCRYSGIERLGGRVFLVVFAMGFCNCIDSTAESPSTSPPEEICESDCGERRCGPDACGGSCQIIAAPQCDSLLPAPVDAAEVGEFVSTNAIPLDCTAYGVEELDLTILSRKLEGMRVFIFGEVHGSHELPALSADIFESLVRAGAIDALALEVGYDVSAAMEEYLQTGSGPLLSQYYFTQIPEGHYFRRLVERSRELTEEGYVFDIFGVDTPWRLAFATEQIKAIADTLPSTAELVTAELPPPLETWGGPDIASDYVDDARAYRDHIRAHLDEICRELSPDVCSDLSRNAEALWLGAVYFSDWSEMTVPEYNEWLTGREDLIFHNFEAKIASDGQLVYAHMGAAHAAKAPPEETNDGLAEVGWRLSSELEITQGRVFTTAPSWGTGSSVSYQGEVLDFDAEPSPVTVLDDLDLGAAFLPTSTPGIGCVDNPLAGYTDTMLQVTYGEAYDALLYVRRLTPL